MTRKNDRQPPQARKARDSATPPNHDAMRGLARSPAQQALVNTREAMRAAEMLPRAQSDLIPHPHDLLMAELRNVERYLMLALDASGDSAHGGVQKKQQSDGEYTK